MPDEEPTTVPGDGRETLRADCANCFALCCVALTLTASSDFAIDKDAGRPCPNLQDDFRCGIHTRLRPKGFSGCTVYDCFGAGQKVSQETYGAATGVRHPTSPRRCSRSSRSCVSSTNCSGISPRP